MKMKGTFGFLMLIFTALMLLTVIGGMSTIFTSIASTWTTNQTAKIADGLAQVLWYFGIVFVSVLGFVLYNAASRGGGGSRRPQEQRETQYAITDGLPTPAQPKLLTADTDADWYEIETPRQQRQLA
jgi:hypothetical protein